MAVSSIPLTGWTEIVLVIIIVFLSYVYYSWTSGYEYWRKRNVPYLKPTFPFGNVADVFLLKKNFRDSFLVLYNLIEDYHFAGIFSLSTPVLIVKDPRLIKMILTKDFGHFTDRGLVPSIRHEPLLNNIFFMESEVWKQMRSKLSPTFTSGKMKMMFTIVDDCSRELESRLKNILQDRGTFEAKHLMARYTFDTIAMSFFGLKATAINNADCELYKTGRKLFEKTWRRKIANMVFVGAPKWYSRFKMHIFQYEACNRFVSIIKETIELRESENITKNDFLDLLIKIKKNISIDGKDTDIGYASNNNVTPEKAGKREDKCKLKVDDVMTQIIGFFIGGFETTSSALSFCLYELAKHPDVQIKLQREIDEARDQHRSITYQMLQELPYLDKVIFEGLRMYSTLPVLNRICVKPYRILDTNVVIEKGCRVIIPSYAIHHDPKYYTEPFKFDPDKFLEENVKSRPAYTFLPFGEGPRICIGMRYAMMQMRLALVTIFSEFNLKLNPKTPVPLTIDCGEFLTRTTDEIFLDLCTRNDFSTIPCEA